MPIADYIRRLSFRKLAGQHAVFHLGKWGLAKTVGGVALKLGAKRAAVGVATTGITGLTVKYQLEEAQRKVKGALDNEVLSSGDELAWLNAAAKPVWDHLNAGLRRVIVEELEPALQRRVPYVGHYLHFRKLTLGEKAPHLGPVTVTQSAHGVDMQIGFAFSGDLAIEFSAGVASLEVADLQVHGTVQVALRPLVNELNPVGGVTISCLDRPTIDLKIKASSELPNLYDFFRETVDDVIADIIVAPNGIAVPIQTFGKETDWPALRYPVPKGLLRLKVLRLDGLPEDVSGSPYVYAQVGATTWRSTSARSGSKGEAEAADDESPAATAFEWAAGNAQDFLVFSENQCVELRVFTASTFGADTLLGRARLPVQSVLGERVEVALQGPQGEPSRAAVALRAAWLAVTEGEQPQGPGHAPQPSVVLADEVFGTLPVSSSALRPESALPVEEPQTLLSVRVDEVAGLPVNGKQRPRFSVRASSGGQSSETGVGHAPTTAVSHLDDETFMALARRLAPHVKAEGLAEALEVSPECAGEFLEPGARRDDVAWAGDWCRRARAAARLLAAGGNPQFGHVCHMPIPSPSELVLELVRHGEGSRRTQVVGRLSHDLADIARNGGALDGPFRLPLADGTECRLEGSVRLRRLEPQT